MPNYQTQRPQTRYGARASGRAAKRGGPGVFILLILLLAGAAFLFRGRLSWFAHVLTSEPATVTQNPSEIEKPQPPVPQPKVKPRKPAEAEGPSAANSATIERVPRPIVSVEVMYPGGKRRTIYPARCLGQLGFRRFEAHNIAPGATCGSRDDRRERRRTSFRRRPGGPVSSCATGLSTPGGADEDRGIGDASGEYR
jgi:hypothetical protein